MARRKGSVGAVRHDDSVLFSSSLPLLVAGIAIGICGGAVVDYFGDHEPSGSVRMLFATPLYVDNVAGVLDIAALNALALDGYTRVTQDATVKSQIRNAKLKEAQQMYPGESFNIPEDEDDSEANNMLFYYQMKTGRNGIGLWKELRDAYTADNGSIRAMMNYIEKKAVPRYFASIGVPKSALPTRLKVNLWAGVLRDGGAEHGAHTHQQDQECLLSGVLYTQVPAGSGPLVFSDPRSATEPEMPDFLPGKDFAFHPKAGDIAMFPPWQVHQVGTGARLLSVDIITAVRALAHFMYFSTGVAG
jgi:hypothetical protein